MLITREERANNPELKKLYYKLTKTNSKMRDRVLNPAFKQYKDYGGRGVTMDPKWVTIAGFVEDVDKIDGWNTNMYLRGELELDKDIKYPGNKRYGPEECKWVTHKENMRFRPSAQKPFYAYNEYTGELVSATSQIAFSEDYGLSDGGINACLRGIKHRTGDYWLWFKGSTPTKLPQRVYYKDADGKVTWDVNDRRLSVKIGKNRSYINALRKRQLTVENPSVTTWVEFVDIEKLVKEYENSKK